MSQFGAAIGDYQKAFKLASELRLWRFVWVPVIIGVVLLTILVLLAYTGAEPSGQWLASFWPFEWGSGFVHSLTYWLGFVLVMLLGGLVYKHLLLAFSAPFMAPVSEKVEEYITGKKLDLTDTTAEKMQVLVRGIRINVRNVIMEVLISLPLMLLSLIPFLNLFTSGLLLFVQAYYVGFGCMDYTLERHLPYEKSINFVRQNKWSAIGNGLIFHLLLMIPVAGVIIVLPISTIAATTTSLRLLQHGKPI